MGGVELSLGDTSQRCAAG